MKILSFADTHINAIQSGRWNPESGLPERMMDFLKSLDTIVNTAIEEKADLVLFAGDVYKDNVPSPAHQAAFESRILRLEDAKIPTYLLIGNHDKGVMSKDHALTPFKTFNTKYIQIVDEIELIKTEMFDLISLPWVHKSKLIIGEVIQQLETLIEEMDPNTINLFMGHCSIAGAKFSSERLIMLGDDLMLPSKLLTESGFDFVITGHIHKHQVIDDLIIYPGSIERVDWGEAGEDKGFVIAEVEKDSLWWEFRKLDTRSMINVVVSLTSKDSILEEIRMSGFFAGVECAKEAMIRIKLQYPEQWAGLINNQTIEQMFPDVFSVQIVHDPIREGRTRLDLEKDVASYSAPELLQMYFEEKGTDEDNIEALMELSGEVM